MDTQDARNATRLPYRLAGTMISDSPETVGGLKLIKNGEEFVAFADPQYAERIVLALNAMETKDASERIA